MNNNTTNMYMTSETQVEQTEPTIEQVIADYKENIEEFKNKVIPEMKSRGIDVLDTIKIVNREMIRLIGFCDEVKDEIEEMIRQYGCKCCIKKKFELLKSRFKFIEFLKHSTQLEYYNYFISQYAIRGELDKMKECIDITEKLSNESLEMSEEVRDDLIFISQEKNYKTGVKSKPEELRKEGGYIEHAMCLKTTLDNNKMIYNMCYDYVDERAKVEIYEYLKKIEIRNPLCII